MRMGKITGNRPVNLRETTFARITTIRERNRISVGTLHYLTPRTSYNMRTYAQLSSIRYNRRVTTGYRTASGVDYAKWSKECRYIPQLLSLTALRHSFLRFELA